MTSDIILFLAQDGLTVGAIYALLAVALVLVFTITRIIFIPQGEFVSYGALTLAALQAGRVPGTLWLMLALAAAVVARDLYAGVRVGDSVAALRKSVRSVAIPLAIFAIAFGLTQIQLPLGARAALAVAIVVPIGTLLYRLAYEPLEHASVLVLLIASVGIHLAMTGLGLAMFGAEGSRTPPFSDYQGSFGPLLVSGQSIAIIGVAGLLMTGLSLFFGRTLAGKALQATAVNRIGARLVGIRTAKAGRVALGLAAGIGAASGILMAPLATIYYDTGFLIGLKGFIAAVIGGLVSYPVAAIGALIVGMLESFTAFQTSALKDVIIFTLILPVLLFRSFTHRDTSGEQNN